MPDNQTGSREYELICYFAINRLRDRERTAVTGGFANAVASLLTEL